MGFKPSPYIACRSYLWAEEIIRSNPEDQSLPFHWKELHLNLPGSDQYDPAKPWVCKRTSSGEIAADVLSYVDDLRISAWSEEACWAATRRTASYCQFLGMQDAPRKRRFPSKTPGAWAGAIVETSDTTGIKVSISQEKWDKTRSYLLELLAALSDRNVLLNHKRLMSIRGFLVYVSRTYPAMVPYLKGLHLTIENWRTGRDAEGWKVIGPQEERDASDIDEEHLESEGTFLTSAVKNPSPPTLVRAVPRLVDDLSCLMELFSTATPVKRLVRPTAVWVVRYGFVDASGSGLGASFQRSDGLSYRVGMWGPDMNDSSSNYRELRNLVEAVESEVADAELNNVELFVFTDNSTAQFAFEKGTSSNRRLFDLVLRLRRLEMQESLIIHVVHVAGTRMIAQGTDGLSRGDMLEGVMAGKNFLDFVPLHLSCRERSPAFDGAIRYLIGDLGIQPTFLEPKDWSIRGHDIAGWKLERKGLWYPKLEQGVYVWCPPPAAAKYAIDELRKARTKRQESFHLFVCPRLMTAIWQRHLYKVADVVFEIPCGVHSIWPADTYEPLIVAIVFPFIAHRPWQLRNTPKVLALGGKLRTLWCSDPSAAWDFLRKLCFLQKKLATMPAGLVWRLLQSQHPGFFFHLRAGRC